MKHIVLTGMMGCGKSTCARILGKKLHRLVVDTDDLVEQKAGMTIAEIFAQQGEEEMRRIETEVCRELSCQRGLIIATGGGLPLREENRNYLRDNSLVFFLNRAPSEIFDTGDMSRRPLAQQGKEAFLQRFSQREPIYRTFCHYEITDFSSPEATVEAILNITEEQL